MKIIYIEYFAVHEKPPTVTNSIERLKVENENNFHSFNSEYSEYDKTVSLYDKKNIEKESKEKLLSFIRTQNTNNEELTLHFFGHGDENTFAQTTKESSILWNELLKNCSGVKTKHKLSINLMAVCHSFKASKFIEEEKLNIDILYGANYETSSVEKSILFYNFPSFTEFTFFIDDEQSLYSEYKNKSINIP